MAIERRMADQKHSISFSSNLPRILHMVIWPLWLVRLKVHQHWAAKVHCRKGNVNSTNTHWLEG